jgi:cell division protein FtsA
MAKVDAHTIVPSVIAASRAVLKEQQIENGVAVIDMGASTTSIAVYEEGDLQYVGVVPVGGANITNDLAIGLKTDPEVAELVKLQHAVASGRNGSEGISIKHDDEIHSFSSDDIDEIVEARLEEIFDAVNKELKKAGRAGQLPSGVVLTGGAANLKNMAEFAKQKLGLAARVGRSSGFGGVAEDVEQPEYAAAIGLMLTDAEGTSANSGKSGVHSRKGDKKGSKDSFKKASNAAQKFLSKFKA